ncbi:MAG: TRAP transporter substrate-binding protein [Treponema sp.]|nr:TRAP transporter substrate-binding protein [Treponema sp.]
MKKASKILTTMLFFATIAALGGCKRSGRIIYRNSAQGSSAQTTSQKENAAPRAVELRITMAHNQTAMDNPYVFGAEAFKEKLEQVSGGGATSVLYHGTMTEDEGELLKKLQSGDANIVVISPGLVTALGVAEVDIFSLEYLFDNFAHWGNVLDGAFGSELSDIVAQKTGGKIRILGYWSAGVRDYYGKKPIYSPKDIAGMTIRIGNSPVQKQFWSGCGAVPVSVGWGDLFNALNEGKVDSAENDYTNFSLKNHHNTTNGKYVCETEHDFTTRLMLVDGSFFDSLTSEQKSWITQAAKYSTQVERQKTFEQASSSKAKVISDGAVVVENKDIDTDAFKRIAYPIQDEFAKKNGMEKFIKMVRESK